MASASWALRCSSYIEHSLIIASIESRVIMPTRVLPAGCRVKNRIGQRGSMDSPEPLVACYSPVCCWAHSGVAGKAFWVCIGDEAQTLLAIHFYPKRVPL